MRIMKIWKVGHGFTGSWGKHMTWAKTQREVIEDLIKIALKEIKNK